MNAFPAGLTDLNIEIWAEDGKVFILKDGKKQSLAEVDADTRLMFVKELGNSVIANYALDQLGIFDPEARLEKFLACRFGGFDNEADFTADGSVEHDYYDCGQRGTCRWEGKLCKNIKVDNGHLTRREIMIIRLISLDLADKQIADMIGIAYNTMTTHRQNIENKLGVASKVGVATFAIKKGIV